MLNRSLVHDTTDGNPDDPHITVFASYKKPSSDKEVSRPFDFDGHIYVEVDENCPIRLPYPEGCTTTTREAYPLEIYEHKSRKLVIESSEIPDWAFEAEWPGIQEDDAEPAASTSEDPKDSQDKKNKKKRRRGKRKPKRTREPAETSAPIAIRVKPTLTRSGKLTFPYSKAQNGKVTAEYEWFQYDEEKGDYWFKCKKYDQWFCAESIPPKQLAQNN